MKLKLTLLAIVAIAGANSLVAAIFPIEKDQNLLGRNGKEYAGLGEKKPWLNNKVKFDNELFQAFDKAKDEAEFDRLLIEGTAKGYISTAEADKLREQFAQSFKLRKAVASEIYGENVPWY